jgi:hypothetical protein
MTEIVDIADLDCIFLTYDEPLREEFWIQVKNIVPWAQRVDGVKGSDAAHKAAAAASSTERFILIDGDNIPDEEFFNQQLTINEENKNHVFRWRARNHVNGLCYGNGGLSSWTRTFVENMRTHENTDGRDESLVEFCFEAGYWAMHDCWSTTYPNGDAYQAWRAGFREGVKMCLDRGARPLVSDFKDRVYHRNLDHLMIWHNVGRDVDYGAWCIAGARQGTYMTMLTNWDYRQVQDFDALAELWLTVKDHQADLVADRVAIDLNNQLDLPMLTMGVDESRFFKHHYSSIRRNRGVMLREIDIIGRQEV